ncbi:MAG: DUF4870 domain-containing protein [Cyanobacteria bacterium P01_A01_bin.45]
MYDTDSRTFLSALSHGAILFSGLIFSIIIPVVVLVLSNDSVVKDNARESVNFHINIWLYGIIIAALIAVTFGSLNFLGFLWFTTQWMVTIWALFCVFSNPDQPFRYPFILRVI